VARPLEFTSYGHNVELAWLLLHAADVLEQTRETYADVARKIFDHTVAYGIDREYGGVYVEGPWDAPTTVTEKQFWQQAELLVGMLDATVMFGDPRYWEAFENVYQFVFEKFVNMKAGGEWYERLDRKGHPIDDALGHAWKISYHTVRSIIQAIKRLDSLIEQRT
jgi:mannobiose 2-epimerase